MQFDRTRIAIRQRGIWEILDLALRVNRIYAQPLWLASAVFIVPLALVNAWLLHPIVADEFTPSTISQYLWLMSLLVFLQTPIATLPATALLGRAMFLQDLSSRSIFGDIRQVLPAIFWTQGVARGGLVAVATLVSWRRELAMGTNSTEIWLVFLCAYSLVPRMTRPFANEIVLLERNPLRRQDATTLTVGRRIRTLHRNSTSDNVGRWITAAFASTVLATSLVLSGWFAAGIITTRWQWGPLVVQWLFPAALWLTAVYTAVVKFIGYLDLRIRREGWEVELKVRAAAQELLENQGLQSQSA